MKRSKGDRKRGHGKEGERGKSVANGGYGRGAAFVLGKGTKVIKSRKREASRRACRGKQGN